MVAPGRLPRRRAIARGALAAFIACVWLNQSVGGKDWEAIRDRVFAAPSAHPLEAARYPFVFLYRRSLDERYYFETAGAVLGEPADEAIVHQMHGRMPAGFDERLPPADGRWHAPYTQVPMEYPPFTLPFFLLPRALTTTFAGFGYVFGGLMGLCLWAGAAAAIAAAGRSSARRRETEAESKWLLASLLLLAQGALAIQRLDAIVALFLGLAAYAAARGKSLGQGAGFGFAGAAKILPVLAFPAVWLASAATSPDARRAKIRGALGAAGALVVGFAWFALDPPAARQMLRYHGDRGLHAESTLGILLGIARSLAGHGAIAPVSFGSQNLEGAVPDACAKLCTPLLVLCSAAFAVAVHRRARREARLCERAASVALAATAILWLTSKVLSPQYLTWGIPLVLAVPGKQGARVAWILAAAMGVTQLYTRGYFDLVVAQAPVALATLAVRQALLVALFVVAARDALATGATEPSPPSRGAT